MEEKNRNKAVVLGVNYYIGLSTLRCLGKQGVYTVACDYDMDGYGLKSKYIKEVLVVEDLKKDQKKLLDDLIEYGKKQDLKPVLIPCHDHYVEFIDNNLNKLKKYYLIPQTKQGLYKEVMDKGTLLDLAEKHGVLAPPTIDSNDKNIEKRVEDELGYPCIVKPTDSPAFVAVFSQKVFIVNNDKELKEALEKAEKHNLEVKVQKIIKGFDDHMYTFDAYLNQDAKVVHYMTARKERQWPINFGASVYIKQRYVPEIIEIGTKFLEDIGYKGFAEIEFKREEGTNNFYLIEINARITNFNQMIEKVGLNIPYIYYCDMIGEPLPPKYIKETTNIAFWYLFDDIFASRAYIKTKQLKLRNIFKSLRTKKVMAIWSIKDPKPTFKFLSNKIKNKIRKRQDKNEKL